jgi:hypothetical protein
MIKFLITTALTYEGHHKYGDKQLIAKREGQYRQFIAAMKDIEIVQHYCECVHPGPTTFLNELVEASQLLYSQTHNPHLRNIGVDEINACKVALDHFQFDDEDIIIKLTGRYFLNSTLLVDEVRAGQNDFDVFYHPFPVGHSGAGQMFTGAYAMRKKHLHEYLHQVDLDKLETQMINIEYDMLTYLQRKDGLRLRPLAKLDITAHSGNGEVIWQV